MDNRQGLWAMVTRQWRGIVACCAIVTAGAASEQAVIGALEVLMKGRTSVVIGHHLGTIRHADVIFVVKDAELAEQGTHEELLAKNGVYAEMQRIQVPEGAKITAAEPAA